MKVLAIDAHPDDLEMSYAEILARYSIRMAMKYLCAMFVMVIKVVCLFFGRISKNT